VEADEEVWASVGRSRRNTPQPTHELISFDSPSSESDGHRKGNSRPAKASSGSLGSNPLKGRLVEFFQRSFASEPSSSALNRIAVAGVVGGSLMLASSSSAPSSVKSASFAVALLNLVGHSFYKQVSAAAGNDSDDDLDDEEAKVRGSFGHAAGAFPLSRTQPHFDNEELIE